MPSATGVGLPRVGNPASVYINSPSTPGALALVLYGWSDTFNPALNVGLPFDLGSLGFGGCALYTSAESTAGLVFDSNGDTNLTFVIPALLKWCDDQLVYQAFVLGSSGDLLASNGLKAQFGS